MEGGTQYLGVVAHILEETSNTTGTGAEVVALFQRLADGLYDDTVSF